MQVKTEEYEIGKRHLARMMGENADTFTQVEIDVRKFRWLIISWFTYLVIVFCIKKAAIQYLMPSGLFQKKARPFMKHPAEYYPQLKRK
jgi:small subunit ribosomal protein S9